MTTHKDNDSFNCLSSLKVGGKEYHYYDLKKAESNGLKGIGRLPYSLKVLLENLLRYEDGQSVKKSHIEAFSEWAQAKTCRHEVAYRPARVLLQDFTGVPAVVDLAVMRDAMNELGGDPKKINPLSPVDLVIDHSVSVEKFGTKQAFEKNVEIEFERNQERYELLKWAQTAFNNFRAVPPGTGICHQVNLEYLAQTVWTSEKDGKQWAYPDTCVGTDSHTTMINGVSVLGWGVGGIEAEAAMLAQPITMMIPDVVGVKLTGQLSDGVTATDLVLTVTEQLRAKGVVGKFVEYFGPGLNNLLLADRATLANMSPEYGATCGFFPTDKETINYLRFTGRDEHRVDLVEQYSQAQGLWHSEQAEDPVFTDTIHVEMADVVASISGPKRPQDRIELTSASSAFSEALDGTFKIKTHDEASAVVGEDFSVNHGSVVIAAITSCTNTSNPSVMLAAGLVAQKAIAKGLKVQPWVKTSLAPGSQVVTDYLVKSGLQHSLDTLGFNLVGYGCTTCIGNSGPLDENISKAIHTKDLVACSVLSGNRNFEGRVNPDVKANYLASPPLVVAYALAGSMKIDISKDSLGKGSDGKDVYLKDIWPSSDEVRKTLLSAVTSEMFKSRYADVFKGPEQWQSIKTTEGFTFDWQEKSTYVRKPTFFEGMESKPETPKDIKGAHVLALLGDSVTTDHISPAGAIKADSPAGRYLDDHGIKKFDFNSFGSRRGNHEVMMRGTFGNIRIRNEMVPGVEGGFTKYVNSGETMSIYDAAMKYKDDGKELVVIGGKEYGTGSSRDWAAKGTILLGVRAVITESFERIHRSNLIGMGVIPAEFCKGQDRKSLKLTGEETFDIDDVAKMKPGGKLACTIHRKDGSQEKIELQSRIDTEDELAYYTNGGILQYVLRNLL